MAPAPFGPAPVHPASAGAPVITTAEAAVGTRAGTGAEVRGQRVTAGAAAGSSASMRRAWPGISSVVEARISRISEGHQSSPSFQGSRRIDSCIRHHRLRKRSKLGRDDKVSGRSAQGTLRRRFPVAESAGDVSRECVQRSSALKLSDECGRRSHAASACGAGGGTATWAWRAVGEHAAKVDVARAGRPGRVWRRGERKGEREVSGHGRQGPCRPPGCHPTRTMRPRR